MKNFKLISLLFFFLAFSLTLASCFNNINSNLDTQPSTTSPTNKSSSGENTITSLELQGTISPQSITFYQYGTHIITTSSEVFALRSQSINLDRYLNQAVSISANKISGYPLSGGPDFLEVIRITTD